jgi:hypothetical protein
MEGCAANARRVPAMHSIKILHVQLRALFMVISGAWSRYSSYQKVRMVSSSGWKLGRAES